MPESQRYAGEQHVLYYRKTKEDLTETYQKVADKANLPEAWEAKLDALLSEEARPALKSMHTLLSEGDKIPYSLKGLDELTEFVKRCDQWIEEANRFLTRRQQNRRKNEKVWRRSSIRAGKDDDKDAHEFSGTLAPSGTDIPVKTETSGTNCAYNECIYACTASDACLAISSTAIDIKHASTVSEKM